MQLARIRVIGLERMHRLLRMIVAPESDWDAGVESTMVVENNIVFEERRNIQFLCERFELNDIIVDIQIGA